MAKVLVGKVISVAMQGVVVVEVTRKTPHPLYKKLMKRSKKFKVAVNGQTVAVGDDVSIIETRPMSKDVHFALKDATEKKAVRVAALKQETKEVVEATVPVEKPKSTVKKTTKKAVKKEAKN